MKPSSLFIGVAAVVAISVGGWFAYATGDSQESEPGQVTGTPGGPRINSVDAPIDHGNRRTAVVDPSQSSQGSSSRAAADWLSSNGYDGLLSAKGDNAVREGAVAKFADALESMEETKKRMARDGSLTPLAKAQLDQSGLFRCEAIAAVNRGDFLVVRCGSFDPWMSRLSSQFRSWTCLQTSPIKTSTGELVQAVVVLRQDGSPAMIEATRAVSAARKQAQAEARNIESKK